VITIRPVRLASVALAALATALALGPQPFAAHHVRVTALHFGVRSVNAE
jgi:hypothetical protein